MRTMMRILVGAPTSVLGLALLSPVVLLAAPFWTVAALQRRIRARLGGDRRATVPWQELMEYAPEVGWRPRGGVDAIADGTPPFHVRTDADGWRGPDTSIEEAEIVVFGDSFAYGHGSDEETFFPNLPGGARIKSIGANGYNMVQGLLWMRRYADRLAGKTVAWLVFYGNDLYENLQPNMGRYRMPFVRGAGTPAPCEIVVGHVSPRPWTFPARTPYKALLAEICTPGALSDRVFEACDFLVGEAAALCGQAGARLAIVGIPQVDTIDPAERERFISRSPEPESCDLRLPDRRLRSICERRGIEFVSLTDHLDRADFLEEDVHWSRRGHEKVAARLRDLAATSGAGLAAAPVSPRRGARAASG